MVAIDVYLMIITLLPISIYAYGRNHDHNRDVYFEVLEPSDISYTFRCRAAGSLGAKFNQVFKNIYLIPAKPLVGCSRLQNAFGLQGNIALVKRGDCSFVTKITIAQESGAVGIIVMNNDPTEDNSFVDMKHDLSQRKVLIPAAFLQFRDGHLILNSLEKSHLIGARITIPLNLTYDEMLKVNRAPGSYWL